MDILLYNYKSRFISYTRLLQIENYVAVLLNQFDLIMIAEMMEESCLLLKRLLKWDLEDIVYINKYALSYQGKHTMLYTVH